MKKALCSSLIFLFFFLPVLSADAEKAYIEGVPHRSQVDHWDCGTASAAMLASYELGEDVTVAEMSSRVSVKQQTVTFFGTHPRILAQVIEEKTLMNTFVESGVDFSRIKAIINSGHPLIALYTFDKEEFPYKGAHYIVITGYDEERGIIYYNDPSAGRETRDISEFWDKFSWPDDEYSKSLSAIGIFRRTIIWTNGQPADNADGPGLPEKFEAGCSCQSARSNVRQEENINAILIAILVLFIAVGVIIRIKGSDR